MGVSDSEWTETMRRLVDEVVTDLDAAVDRVVLRMRSEIPRYGSLAVDDLRFAIAGSIIRGLHAVRDRRPPTEEELSLFATLAEIRAAQGFPVQSVLEGYRAGVREMWHLLIERAKELALPQSVLLEAAELVWEWADSITHRGVAAFQNAQLVLAREDQNRRGNFLRGLLFDSIGGEELRAGAVAFGLPDDRLYVPFRARPLAPGIAVSELERRIVPAASRSGEPCLLGVIDGDLAGILTGPPLSEGTSAAVGFGASVSLTRIGSSFRSATRACLTAHKFGMEGAFSLDDLSLRAAIASEEEIGDLLVKRFIEPLERHGKFGEVLLETLRRFFRHQGDIEAVAGTLSVHPNTLRHRLHRFEEMTGARMTSLQDLFGIWWALERAQLVSVPATREAEP